MIWKTESGCDGGKTNDGFFGLAWPVRVGRLARNGAWLVVVAMALASPSALAETTRDVLLILSYDRLLPANIEGEAGLREGFAARPDLPVAISVEYLDNLRFNGDNYERSFLAYLREKYALHPPDVVMVAGTESLDFVLRNRSGLFAQVPVVHMSVMDNELRSRSPLPPDVVGTPLAYDLVGTVAQSLRWHPKARRLVVVTGGSPWDREWEARVRAQVGDLPPGLSVEFMAGLATGELQRRLRALGSDAIVFTPGYFRDGDGREFKPRETVRMIAAASSVPVYGASYSTLIGTGIVGGRMASIDAIGRVGAETAIQLLEGADPANVNRPEVMPTPLQVDWRQLERWGVPTRDVPADAIVYFREPSLWEAHREQVLIGVAVMVVQSVLIFALLFERRRRRRTMADLERSEELIQLAAQAANLSTWVLDAGAIKAAGAAAVPGTELGSRGSLADFSKTLARVAPPDRPMVDAALRDALESHGEFEVEYRLEDSPGELTWQLARGRADHAGAPRLLGVAIDITQRKRAEAQAAHDRTALYHMTRVSLLGQLSAAIAHQLNQPLASILGNAEAAQMMLDQEPLDLQEIRAIFADIVAEDQRAAQVIRRLSLLFKRGKSVFETLDVNDLARDTIEFTRGALALRQVVVITQFEPELPPVLGDRVQLQQLLLNLIFNAADAMEGLFGDDRQMTISTSRQDEHLTICVADRGPGVPAETRDKVFDPFWTTRPDGMGMGLAVCRSIAEAHHGRLTVADAPGGGAIFCIILPLQASS